MSKILIVISSLFLFAACSTVGKKSDSASADADSFANVSEKYRIASEGLEPFTAIKGSKTGAKASDRVFFAYDSSVIAPSEQKTLDRQVSWLKKHSDVNVTVEGHCDERGTREYNLALGERRAAAVKKYLTASGVSDGRIETVSYGKERPAVEGSSSDALAENRRAVTVLKK